jgi:hypothetical protein
MEYANAKGASSPAKRSQAMDTPLLHVRGLFANAEDVEG